MSDPARDLIRAMAELVPDPESPTRLATVTAVSATGVSVLFDGEATASAREYARLAGAAVGDRVVMLRVGSSWVTLGAIASMSVADGGELYASGPWAAGAPPNSTTGSAFTINRAGRYQFDVQMSGYSASAAAVNFAVYLDGSLTGTRPFFFNTTNTHHTGPRLVWQSTLDDGVHYLYAAFGGSSDANDVLSATWTRIA